MPFHDTRPAGGRNLPSVFSTSRTFTLLFVTCVVVTAVLTGGSVQALQETDPVDDPAAPATEEPSTEDLAQDELLREGATVYSQICASCHQAGGSGLEGQFPPLLGNPNVDDAAYVESVITNGRQGEIVVDGVTYNGVMPSFSTLSDDDTAAVIAFIQNDFVAPALEAVVPLGPVAGTELPGLSNMTTLVAFAITAALVLMVLGPRILSENDRLNVPWLDAWLKTALIVSSVILLTVIIPDWAVRNSTVTELSRFAQDLIGVSLWLLGMVTVAWSLWYAHRRSRV